MAPLNESKRQVPLSFHPTEVNISDVLGLIRTWLLENVERMRRIGGMNARAGAVETPDTLRNGSHKCTVWFEPTVASFSLLSKNTDMCNTEQLIEEQMADDGKQGEFVTLVPTSQTLHVVAELDN